MIIVSPVVFLCQKHGFGRGGFFFFFCGTFFFLPFSLSFFFFLYCGWLQRVREKTEEGGQEILQMSTRTFLLILLILLQFCKLPEIE